nr:PREDICTED: short-chain dehydrogenase/reductase family 16C member 6-like [Linepithema humile]
MFLLAEIFVLLFKVLYYICESVVKLFAPVKAKSVASEIVLVTGAGHGIGKELAIGYALLGATVVCWDINEKTNQQTKNEIKKMGKDSIHAYRCDVTNREEVFKVAEKVRTEVGDVTILINNAGTLRAFLPSMIEKNHGHVVAVSSLLAIVTLMYATVYSPTKSAVRALMESFNEELRLSSKGKSLIKFTTVFPTLVFNGMLKKLVMRNFPNKAQECVKDFVNLSAEPDN